MRFAVSEKEREVTFRLAKKLHPLEQVQGAAHVLGDRATAFVEEAKGSWVLTLCAKGPCAKADLEALGREFVDELLNQALRLRLLANARPVFEHIVARAVVSARRDPADPDQPAAARAEELTAEQKAELEALIAEAERELDARRSAGTAAKTAQTWEERHGRSRTKR
ncbi:MAG: hypothetical protein KGL53_08025 [Elusimicrobia bacterium]|nr:hypothetical protein [Elusimicrobiota bacterium]